MLPGRRGEKVGRTIGRNCEFFRQYNGADNLNNSNQRRCIIEMCIIPVTGDFEKINDVLAILVLSLTFAVMVIAAVAVVFRMNALAVCPVQKGHDIGAVFVVVDMDVEAHDSRQICKANQHTCQRCQYSLDPVHVANIQKN